MITQNEKYFPKNSFSVIKRLAELETFILYCPELKTPFTEIWSTKKWTKLYKITKIKKFKRLANVNKGSIWN